jgi:hypothetical protein
MRILKQSGRVTALALTVSAVAALAACSSLKDNLLEAVDPDIIDPANVQSPGGATAVRNGALSRLRTITADGESTWLFGGLLVDEWATSSTFVQNDETDQRNMKLDNGTITTELRALYRARTAANQAVALLKEWKPTPVADIGEMYFVRGFAELQLASDFCNGIPLSDGAGDGIVYGNPLTVKEVFAAANASFDTAMSMSTGTDAASVNVNRASRIGKARALLGLGLTNAPAAAALVTAIPTNYRYDVTASLSGGNNVLWSQPFSSNRYVLSDSIQGNNRLLLIKNAIPFFSAKDPRVPSNYKISSNGRDTVKAQDGGTFVIEVQLWGQVSATSVVNGIDARLIEAEAALQAGNSAGMMTFLNGLRSTAQVITPAAAPHAGVTTPVMAALTDPGNKVGRENLLFREKAFWQFGRGHRLGDLRRLIRDYGRAADGSDAGGYPIGSHPKGGVFGGDLNLPVVQDEQANPNFSGCIDRKA